MGKYSQVKNTRFHYTDRISRNSFLCWEQSASNVGFCENREPGRNWEEIRRRDWSHKQSLSPSEPEEMNRKAQWRSVSSLMHTTLTDLTQGPMKSYRALSFIFFPVSPFHSPSSLSLLLPILKYYMANRYELSPIRMTPLPMRAICVHGNPGYRDCADHNLTLLQRGLCDVWLWLLTWLELEVHRRLGIHTTKCSISITLYPLKWALYWHYHHHGGHLRVPIAFN